MQQRCCLCLQCRTALFPGQPCDCAADAQVACFEEKTEREQIVSAVWGNEDTRTAALRVLDRARNRVAGASIGGLAAGIAISEGLWGFGPGVALAGVVGALASGAVARRYSGGGKLAPLGSREHEGTQGLGLRAEILGSHDLVSPATGHACLAYCIELRVLRGRGEWVMYRDAVTCGFVAKLGTGETIRVPQGRLHFAGLAPEILDVDNLELDAYLHAVDPHHADSDHFRPLHFNLVREEVLFAGDEVDLRGDFRPALVSQAEVPYREPVATYLQPQGIPEVRLLR